VWQENAWFRFTHMQTCTHSKSKQVSGQGGAFGLGIMCHDFLVVTFQYHNNNLLVFELLWIEDIIYYHKGGGTERSRESPETSRQWRRS